MYKPLHQYLGLSDSSFPVTAQAIKESFSIPIYPSLSDNECDKVCQSLQAGIHEPHAKEVLTLAPVNAIG